MVNIHQILQGCKRGERHSQQALYQHYAPTLLALCMRYTKHKEEAEDLLQEGFLIIFTKIDQFKNDGSFEGWMRKIMVNCALQKYRSQKNKLHIAPVEILDYDKAQLDTILPTIAQKELLKLIQQLPPSYKLIFNLYVFEGYKHREIALLLGISEGTCKSNLFDARVILQKGVLNNLKTKQIINA